MSVMPSSPDRKRLTLATIAAVIGAATVLVLAVLPAEYGIDPTGFGALLGITKLHAPADVPPVANESGGGPRTTYAYQARFALVEREVGNWSGEVTRDATQDTISVPLALNNLTRLTARLTWTDDEPSSGPDSLEVSLRGPRQRESDLVQSATGFANASVLWRSAPFPQPTDDGGLRIETATDASSAGDWRIVVRLYATRATESAPDEGNSYTVRLFAEQWTLDAREIGSASDKVTLTLQPRGQVEYKFSMQPNATMRYAWNASAVVHSDLHADTAENPDDFTVTKIADVDQDEGTYTAPFYGRHGWYWRNDNAFPVTITLETSGDYAILGVV